MNSIWLFFIIRDLSRFGINDNNNNTDRFDWIAAARTDTRRQTPRIRYQSATEFVIVFFIVMKRRMNQSRICRRVDARSATNRCLVQISFFVFVYRDLRCNGHIRKLPVAKWFDLESLTDAKLNELATQVFRNIFWRKNLFVLIAWIRNKRFEQISLRKAPRLEKLQLQQKQDSNRVHNFHLFSPRWSIGRRSIERRRAEHRTIGQTASVGNTNHGSQFSFDFHYHRNIVTFFELIKGKILSDFVFLFKSMYHFSYGGVEVQIFKLFSNDFFHNRFFKKCLRNCWRMRSTMFVRSLQK